MVWRVIFYCILDILGSIICDSGSYLNFVNCQTRMVIWAEFTQIISKDIPWTEGELYPYCLCVMIVRLCLYTSVDAHSLKRKLSPYCHLGIVVSLCLHTKSLQIPHQPGADLLPRCNMEWKSGLCSLWLE